MDSTCTGMPKPAAKPAEPTLEYLQSIKKVEFAAPKKS